MFKGSGVFQHKVIQRMWAWGGPVNRTHVCIQSCNFGCNFGAGAITSLKRQSSRVGYGRKDAENSPRGAVFCRLITGTVINRRFSQQVSSVLEAEACFARQGNLVSEVYLTGSFRLLTPNKLVLQAGSYRMMTTNLYASQTHTHTSRELPIDFTFVQEVTAFATHLSIQQSGQVGLISKLTAGFARPNIAGRSNCISFGDNMASLSSTRVHEFTYVSQCLRCTQRMWYLPCSRHSNGVGDR